MTTRSRPPYVADERAQLLGWFQLQRDIVVLKAEGLSEEDAHRVVVPSSPLMTVAGIVSHLRWAEHLWFEVAFHGTPPGDAPEFSDDPEDLDFRLGRDKSLPTLIEEYRTQCRHSDEIIATAQLDDTGRYGGFPSAGSTLRWMLIHMTEETARHAGHLDIIRELLDGQRSYY